MKTIREVDTLNVMDVDTLSVDLWYPRQENRYTSIKINLMDVRAANDIEISYDFDRDGWVIKSDLCNPNKPYECQDEYYEVAFIPAWVQHPVTGKS